MSKVVDEQVCVRCGLGVEGPERGERDPEFLMSVVHIRNRTIERQKAELERLRAIEERARHLTASAGFRPDLKSPFGTEVVVVLRDRFDALGEALDV